MFPTEEKALVWDLSKTLAAQIIAELKGEYGFELMADHTCLSYKEEALLALAQILERRGLYAIESKVGVS